MIHLAIAMLAAKKAINKYKLDKLHEGVNIPYITIRALIAMHIIHTNKVMIHGRVAQYVKRCEINDLAAAFEYSTYVRTYHLQELIELGFVETFYHHYRPTNKGRQEIKKIGLYLSRLVAKYHCQPEKIPKK